MNIEEIGSFLRFVTPTAITGVRMPSAPNVFLDVVIQSNYGSLYLTGRSIDLPDRTELFVIQASVSTDAPRWIDSDTGTRVPTFDLLKYWYSRSSSSVWTSRRLAKMYFDPAAMGIEGSICDGGSAPSAFEICSDEKLDSPRIVVYATSEFPCALEVTDDPKRCREIISYLTSDFGIPPPSNGV